MEALHLISVFKDSKRCPMCESSIDQDSIKLTASHGRKGWPQYVRTLRQVKPSHFGISKRGYYFKK